jgi:hypothetical protein
VIETHTQTDLKNGLTNIKLKESQEDFLCNYNCKQIHTLMASKEFDGSIQWLARQMNESLDVVDTHLKSLVFLDIVDVVDGKFQRKDNEYLLDTPDNVDKDHLIDSFKVLSRQVVNDLNSENVKLAEFQMVLSNKKSILKLKSTIQQALDEFIVESSQEQEDCIFSLSLSSISKNINGGLS